MSLEMFSLKDRVVLVTGVGSGIGQAILLGMAGAGARVVGVYRKNYEETQNLLEDRGADFHLLQADLAAQEEARMLIGKAVACFGQIDVLVNNAGATRRAPAQDVAEEEPREPIVLSGGFRGFDVLDGAPAVLDVPVGEGRVVVIAPAVARRFQDHHDYPLLWNALMHWNDMPAPDPAGEKRR